MPQPGELCVCRFSSDQQWYRACCDTIYSEHDIEVTFIDYGNSERTSTTELRPAMENRLIKLPRQVGVPEHSITPVAWTSGGGGSDVKSWKLWPAFLWCHNFSSFFWEIAEYCHVDVSTGHSLSVGCRPTDYQRTLGVGPVLCAASADGAIYCCPV